MGVTDDQDRVAQIRARAEALVSKFTPYRLAEKLAEKEAELAAATLRADELQELLDKSFASGNEMYAAYQAQQTQLAAETLRADTAERELAQIHGLSPRMTPTKVHSCGCETAFDTEAWRSVTVKSCGYMNLSTGVLWPNGRSTSEVNPM